MQRVRLMEELCAELYTKEKIRGFLHLYIGEEAIAATAGELLRKTDTITSTHRGHGHCIAKGGKTDRMMAELLGRKNGYCGGKGGSMHMADVNRNFWGGHAIVGAHLPLAAGLALGDQYQKTDGVTICMFGDGASNIGFFHEALNLSKVWKLPVLWVCENNQYGMGTAIDRASAVSEIVQKACGYGMKADQENGMDLMAVYEKAHEMIERVRGGEGPMFLEYMTYRFRGHSMGDPERYRKSDEVKRWEKDDPIGIFNDRLVKDKIATEAGLKKIEQDIEAEVEDAVRFAEESPEPAAEELFTDIYAQGG